MGGTRRADTNAVSSLLLFCGTATTGCHGVVEANPVEALTFGFRVRQNQNTAEVPVLITGRGWCLLGDDGTYQAARPEVEAS